MTDRIIRTLKTEARKPGRSLLLSLIFTGLGQMYNGELAKGAAFCLMRAVALAALPLSVIERAAAPSAVTALCLAAAVLILTAASPAEAFIRARRRPDLPVRAYGSAPWYCAFAAGCALVTALAAIFMAAFFTVVLIEDGAAGPLLGPGDVVLVNRYRPEKAARGELTVAGGIPARVIALEGDAVKYEGNIFFVNGRALPLGFLNDRAIAGFTADRGDVLSESGDAGKYPVRFRRSPEITLAGLETKVRAGHLLVASDTRLEKNFARIVPVGSVRGRVAGVLFSVRLSKIGMNAFGGLR
jgi:hypothetical protein